MENWNNLQDCEEVALVPNFLIKSKLLLTEKIRKKICEKFKENGLNRRV